MPVMLMTSDDVEQWLRGVSVADALKMQKPAPDDAIVIRPSEKKGGLAPSIHLAAEQFAA
jgi:putative SOS response-associated peptidase YedK